MRLLYILTTGRKNVGQSSWAWTAGYSCYQIIIFYICHVTLKFGIVIGQGYIAQMQGLCAHNHIILQVWGLTTCCFSNADNIRSHPNTVVAAIPATEGWGNSHIQLPSLCGCKYAVASVDTFHWVIHTNRPSETPTKPGRKQGRQIYYWHLDKEHSNLAPQV